jgi:hypothetical protein
MNDKPEKPGKTRSYPASYEKLIPIALAIIVVAIVALLAFAAAAALGLVPGAH